MIRNWYFPYWHRGWGTSKKLPDEWDTILTGWWISKVSICKVGVAYLTVEASNSLQQQKTVHLSWTHSQKIPKNRKTARTSRNHWMRLVRRPMFSVTPSGVANSLILASPEVQWLYITPKSFTKTREQIRVKSRHFLKSQISSSPCSWVTHSFEMGTDMSPPPGWLHERGWLPDTPG